MTLADSHFTRGALDDNDSVASSRIAKEAIFGLERVANSSASMHVALQGSFVAFANSITSCPFLGCVRIQLLSSSVFSFGFIVLSESSSAMFICYRFLLDVDSYHKENGADRDEHPN